MNTESQTDQLKQRIAAAIAPQSTFENSALSDKAKSLLIHVNDLLRDCLKHIEELEGKVSELKAVGYHILKDFKETTVSYESQLRERDADCAAMREAFETGRSRVYTNFAHVPEALRAADWIWISMTPALKSDAGKALLDRLQAVEAERDRYKAALETLKQSAETSWQFKVVSEALQPAQKEQK